MKRKIILYLAILLVSLMYVIPFFAKESEVKTTVEVKGETTTFTSYYIYEDNQLVELKDDVKEADLKLEFQIQTRQIENYISKISVQYQYDWIKTPINRFCDVMSVAWDSDKFELDEMTFEKADLYAKQNKTYEFNHENRGTSYSPQSVTWDADLLGLHHNVNGLSGFGKFDLIPRVQVPIQTSIHLHGSYTHKFLGI